MHDYYSYNIEELKKHSNIPVISFSSSEDVFKKIAREMADGIISNNREGKETKYILPVGPVGQYTYFVDIVNSEKISLKNCWFFNMDEYLNDDKSWIDSSSALSFRGYMERNVYSRIDPELVVPQSQRFFPDPQDPSVVTKKLEAMGWADACFGGIGINGHIAFNEAQEELSVEEFSNLKTRVLHISNETKTANAIGDLGGAIEDMPKYAATIGMYEILHSKKIVLGVFRNWHRAVVRRAGCGKVEASFPVSIIQNHINAKIYVNDVASEKAF